MELNCYKEFRSFLIPEAIVQNTILVLKKRVNTMQPLFLCRTW